jgi:hypothetical protein
MANITPLERYRSYLEALDEEVRRPQEGNEYLELLSPSEVIDLLCARDEIAEMHLDSSQCAEVERLDTLLIKHHLLVPQNIPPYPDEPRAHWWWHLHEGPQVREQALAAGRG